MLTSPAGVPRSRRDARCSFPATQTRVAEPASSAREDRHERRLVPRTNSTTAACKDYYCRHTAFIIGVWRMLLHRPFEAITPTLDGDVLLVLARAEASFTGGELARLIPHASTDGVRKAAQRLVKHGAVTLEQVGNAYNYRLNRDHVLADAIVAIASAQDLVAGRVRVHVDRWPVPPEAVVLFGSAARREMTAGSDIDLLVVGDEEIENSVFALADSMTSWTGNDVRALRLDKAQVSRRLADHDTLLDEILRDGRVLWGPDGYLRQLRRTRAT